jgi:hypothetical protein
VLPGATISSARFQLDSQTNSWGNTTVSVFAIVDESEDWDLNNLPEDQIIGPSAPKSDYESFEWTGDTNVQQRFNSPTPFLDEGSGVSAETRELELAIFLEDQDPFTEESNEFGGYAGADGPGTAGSADNGDNIWPVKNAIDIDVTDLVKWKLGQNAAYSSFTPGDTELTILVRTEIPEAGGENGFVRFISKESDFLGGDLDLAPGRLVIVAEGGALTGDFDGSGVLDAPDINALTSVVAGSAGGPQFDLNGDGAFTEADIRVWVKDLFGSWIGDADLNHEFNSSDLITVLAAGKYEVDVDSVWTEGDFTGDARTNSGDLVAALADGGYELGTPPAAVNAVPEPQAWSLALLALLGTMGFGRSRMRPACG